MLKSPGRKIPLFGSVFSVMLLLSSKQLLVSSQTNVSTRAFPTFQDMEISFNQRAYLYQQLVTTYDVPKSLAVSILQKNRPPFCRAIINCDENERFRSIDGTCNNLQNPKWGSTFGKYTRLAPAVYTDGVSQMVNVGPWLSSNLPGPRAISATYGLALATDPTLNQIDPEITTMVPQFGQFVDHDMTATPKIDRQCCSLGANCGGDNIDIPANDYFYANASSPPRSCLDFSRSVPFCFPTESGVREQFNAITGFLDASHVYGSTKERSNQLRTFTSGKLRVNGLNPKLPPTIQEIELALGISFQFEPMYAGGSRQPNVIGKFLAGDDRINENPTLTALHLLFLREHNRLADNILVANPAWNDEQIYQQARRILIAEWQNIIYGEYLPILLGSTTMATFDLDLTRSQFTIYKDQVDPSIFNSFATAAFRFGHSMINGLVDMVNGLRSTGTYLLRDTFFDSDLIEQENGFNYLLGGLMTQNSQALDLYTTEEVTNFLFREKTQNFGSDLIAINIQRGRDHGLPSYNEYRRICGLTTLTSDWENKPDEILEENWLSLQTAGYKSPLDIDLYIGGLSEDFFHEGIPGATFSCLLGLQFQKLKEGDRFFFTHSGQINSLNPTQLSVIRRRTLGDIICDNTDIKSTTVNVFKTPSRRNPWRSCAATTRAKIDVSIF